MYGKGILKGLSVTWKRFWDTYVDDISWLLRGKKRYHSEEGIKHRPGVEKSIVRGQPPDCRAWQRARDTGCGQARGPESQAGPADTRPA